MTNADRGCKANGYTTTDWTPLNAEQLVERRAKIRSFTATPAAADWARVLPPEENDTGAG